MEYLTAKNSTILISKLEKNEILFKAKLTLGIAQVTSGFLLLISWTFQLHEEKESILHHRHMWVPICLCIMMIQTVLLNFGPSFSALHIVHSCSTMKSIFFFSFFSDIPKSVDIVLRTRLKSNNLKVNKILLG